AVVRARRRARVRAVRAGLRRRAVRGGPGRGGRAAAARDVGCGSQRASAGPAGVDGPVQPRPQEGVVALKGLLRTALVLGLAPAPLCLADTGGAVRRLAAGGGARHAAADRVPLSTPVGDAIRYADLVPRMGDVPPGSRIVLRGPTRRGLMDALSATA